MYSLLCRTVGVIPHTPWEKSVEAADGQEEDLSDGTMPILRPVGRRDISIVPPCWHSHAGVKLRRWLRSTFSAQVCVCVSVSSCLLHRQLAIPHAVHKVTSVCSWGAVCEMDLQLVLPFTGQRLSSNMRGYRVGTTSMEVN